MAKKNKNWIQGAIKRPGALKRKAKQAEMSTQKFAKKVTSKKSKGKYSERTRRQANLAQTLAKFQSGTPGSIYNTPTNQNDLGFAGAQQAQLALQQSQFQAKQMQDQKLADSKLQEEQENQEFAKTMATQGSKFLKDANAARTATQNVAGASRFGYLNNANVLGAGASLAGTAVRKLSDDNDDTKINFGEGLGGIMQGAGSGASIGSALGPVGTVVGGLAGAGLSTYQMLKSRNQAREDKTKETEYQMNAAEQQRLLAEQAATGGMDMGYNVGSSMSNSYLPGQQMMQFEMGGDPHKRMLRKQNRQTRKAQKKYERASKKANRKGISPYEDGGQMIKRADGSYSQRGLWDNIRANKGSGKKPTKEMLKQEKKIKGRKKYQGGTPAGSVFEEMQQAANLNAQLNPQLAAQVANMPQSNDQLSSMTDQQMAQNERRVVNQQTQENWDNSKRAMQEVASNPEVAMDLAQLGLAGVAASEIPVASQIAGGVNALGYGARGLYYGGKSAYLGGDAGYAAKAGLYGTLSGLSAVGMVPGAGLAADASVLGTAGTKIMQGIGSGASRFASTGLGKAANILHHTPVGHGLHTGANISKGINVGTAGQINPTGSAAKGISAIQSSMPPVKPSYIPSGLFYSPKFKNGGQIKPLGGGAVEFVGPKHEKGGIKLDENTEVEGGETMDKVKFAQGGNVGDYIFSDHLKMNGKTFARRHKEMLRNGASQADIQQLAKMQETVAEKQGKDENGPRGAHYIAKMGGVRKYQNGTTAFNPISNIDFGPSSGYIPAPEFPNLVTAQLDPESAFSTIKPENQHRNAVGGYNRTPAEDNSDLDISTNTEVTLDEIEAAKLNNPWFDWTDFDHTNKEDVKRFQKAFNEKAPKDKQIEEDGMFGEQTAKVFIPYEDIPDEPGGGGDENDGGGEEDPGGSQETGEEDIPDSGIPPISLRENVLLPWQAMGPLSALGSKYPQPERVAPGTVKNPNLARVNFNAERAAGAANTNATNKFIQSSNSGPGAIAAQMATTNAQRQNNMQLANQEARENKQLFNQEAMAGMQANQANVANAMQANQFNAQNQNYRDTMEYEKRMNAANQLGNVAAQYGMDQRAYRAEERVAEANQISGEYTRQKYYEELARQAKNKRSPYYGMGDAQLRDTAARMTQNTGEWANQDAFRADAMAYQRQLAQQQASQDTVKKRKGGKYISKLNKIRR